MITPTILRQYEVYLQDVAKMHPPSYLDGLLFVLNQNSNTTLIPPSKRTNLHPFLIPLCYNSESQTTTGLLRWPTPPDGMEAPVVQSRTGDLSVTMLSPSVKQHVTRTLATADFSGNSSLCAAIRKGSSLALAYQNGDTDKSGLGLERFLVLQVGTFPDLYEGLATFHRAKGDLKSALVTCERAATVHPGWARAHVFHTRMLADLGRESEARDAARFCLQMPLWTIGSAADVKEMARMAGYVEADSLGRIYRRLFEDKREKEIEEGKAPQQVALDRAAYLLDLCVAEEWNDWEKSKEELATLYDEAGLEEMATFIRY